MYPNPYTPVQPVVPITRSSTLALVSLLGGIAGFTVLPFLGSIVAIITGHMAKSEINKSAGTVTGGGMATIGLILGYLALVTGICLVCLFVILPIFGVSFLGLLGLSSPSYGY